MLSESMLSESGKMEKEAIKESLDIYSESKWSKLNIWGSKVLSKDPNKKCAVHLLNALLQKIKGTLKSHIGSRETKY